MSIKNAKEILSSILKSDDKMSDYLEVSVQDLWNLENELNKYVDHDDEYYYDKDYYDDIYDEYDDEYDDDLDYDEEYIEKIREYIEKISNNIDSVPVIELRKYVDAEIKEMQIKDLYIIDRIYNAFNIKEEEPEFAIHEYISWLSYKYNSDFPWTTEFTLEQRIITGILDLPTEFQTRENQEEILKRFKLIS